MLRVGSLALWQKIASGCPAPARLAIALAALATAGAAAPEGLTATPLAPRSGPRGRTMFTVMPPQQTGVVADNPYGDPKMWAERYQEFALGSMGTGIAIGDYDNDGRPDIFVVSKTGQCRLFRNLGNWKFEDVTEQAGLLENAGGGWLKGVVGGGAGPDVGAWKQGATFADVNNDGWVDLYVCRYNAPNLLYINQHDGTFKEEAQLRGLAVVDACVVGAFCDYDRDGWLDVYVQTNMLDAAKHPEGQRDYLFHNNRDGTFTDVTRRAGIAGATLAHSSIWWDYDGDGWPDLYVTNDFSGPDALYHNNHDGTFTNVIDRMFPHLPESSMGADFGDVNNDGRMDLFVADMAATTHEKDQRGMAAARGLNREAGQVGGPPQFPHNAFFLNSGSGPMREMAYLTGLAATDWTWSVRLEDLDNDGRLDLQVTNGMNREYQNSDLRERIILAETLAERMRIMRGSPMMRERHLAFRNRGDLTFEDVGAAWGLDQVGVSFGAAFADFDGDGDLDLIYANYEAGPTLLRNDCDTGHRLVVALRGTRSNRLGIGAEVRIETASGIQVRQLTLTRGYLSNSEPIAHFGLGDDPAIKRLTVAWPSGATQVFENLPADQRLTITEPAAGPPPVIATTPGQRPDTGPTSGTPVQFEDVSAAFHLELSAREDSREETSLQPLAPMRFNHRGPALAVADLNGDGDPDLVLAGTSSDPARILVRSGASFSAIPVPGLAGSDALPDGPVLAFDANGSGSNGLLVTKAGTTLRDGSPEYQPRLFFNDGHGNLQPAPAGALPTLPISVGALAAADFDHDGRLDVFIGGRVVPGSYPLPPTSALLRNRGGRFEDVTHELAPALEQVGMVTSAIWSDVDGDGWVDLLVTLEWGQVRCFHNDAGRGFSDWTEKLGFAAAGSGWWTSIASADFNGDGRPDFVVGNVGLNTPYQATAEHPTLLYYGDFAGSGQPVVVEAYYEGDKLFPRRTRTELGARIPSIRQRFRRNDLYARATLADVLGEAALKSARRFAATELRSGVFLSQSDGTYRFEPLPRIAQIAPCQGLVAGDFDGDGRADIFFVQNSYAPPPSIGQFDGGLGQLLRGDGQGHFAAVEPADSGLIAPGDAKALVALDLNHDGWPDFVASRNNGTTLAFQNRGRPGYHSLAVTLHGAAGNPTGIGARVTLELADGTKQTAEIAAGAGYYSQSLAACYFGYPERNPPRKLVVRWPNGIVSEQPVPAGTAMITVPMPAR